MFSSGGGGMFGSKFGSTGTGSSVFGSSTNTGFGSYNAAGGEGPEGTTIPFEPVRGNDTMVRNGEQKDTPTKHLCITAMEKYKNRSIEELRIFDYIANRKGGGTAGTATNAFGGGMNTTSQPASSSLFGQSKPSIFGSAATTGSAFGSTATTGNTFGATSTGFGAAKPAFGGTTGGSLFGASSAAPASSGSLFGASTATSSPFGQTAQQSGGLFGSKPAFGSPAQPATGSLFGSTTQTQQQQPSLFGNTASTGGGLFGSSTATTSAGSGFSFGNTNTATTSAPAFGSTFGATTTTSTANPFGAKPAGTGFGFGNTATSSSGGGLFGNTATAAKPAGTGLFGSTQPATQTTGLFGSTAQPASTGLFGAKPAGTGLFGSTATSAAPAFGAAQQAPTVQQVQAPPIILGGGFDESAIQRSIIEAQLSTNPYGDGPILRGKLGYRGPEKDYSTVASNGESTDVQAELRKIAMEALIPEANKSLNTTLNSSNASLDKSKAMLALSPGYMSLNYKPLVSMPHLGFARPEGRSSLYLSLSKKAESVVKDNSILNNSRNGTYKNPKEFDPSVIKRSSANTSNLDSSLIQGDSTPSESSPAPRRRSVCFADEADLDGPRKLNFDAVADDRPSLASQPKGILVTAESRLQKASNGVPEPEEHNNLDNTINANVTVAQKDLTFVVSPSEKQTIQDGTGDDVLSTSLSTIDGYYTVPTLEELKASYKDGRVFIRNGLTVGRTGYGSVFWPGQFELSTLDFENLVHFRQKEVVVYPDDEKKPPLGVDLNRPAEVALERVWPYDKNTKEFIKDAAAVNAIQFRNRLERACSRMDATFIDYTLSTGTWTFSVKHFSKYGLVDDDDDDVVMDPVEMKALAKQREQLSKIQRAHVPNTVPVQVKVPFREIQPTTLNSLLNGGLSGDTPSVKTEVKPFEVGFLNTCDYGAVDPKRIKLDETASIFNTSALLKTEVTAEEPAPTYTAKPLVAREPVATDLLKVDPKQTIASRKSMYAQAPRIQWHPNKAGFFLHRLNEPNVVGVFMIKPVPLLLDYFKRVLAEQDRTAELDQILRTELLHFSPPSPLIQLLDSYLYFIKCGNSPDAVINNEFEALCASLLLAPNAPNTAIEQRLRFGDWLRIKLAPYLKEILSTARQDPSEATRVIFECLVHGNIDQAMRQALNYKMYNLALYLSLYKCGNSVECKAAFMQQKTDLERIFSRGSPDQYLLKIYEILAGPRDEKGLPRPGLSYFQGLSWFQILGTFIWYSSVPSDTLNDWVEFYDNLVKGGALPETPVNLEYLSSK